MKRDQLTTSRRVPGSIAGILRELELRQPLVVVRDQIAQLLAEIGSPLSVREAADRLVREGWLGPLRTRGAWEFIPAARAGSISSGDRWLELRALLALKPESPVAVAFESAVWELGFSSHPPQRSVVAHSPGWRPPQSLIKEFTCVRHDWRLEPTVVYGLPVWHPATVVVAAADKPRYQGNWANADGWLPVAMQATTPAEVLTEASGRSGATLIRLSYLAEWSGRDDLVEALEPMTPADLPVTYLGPRRRDGKWVSRWRIYDSILPKR